MNLFIDVDSNAETGWLGYDFVVNFPRMGALSKHASDRDRFDWTTVEGTGLKLKFKGAELELSIPWKALGRSSPATFDFKWADNCIQSGTWSDFTLNGDAAPNDRFNYRAVVK
jgi:hypothetical protein